jgi:hypothetical protein
MVAFLATFSDAFMVAYWVPKVMVAFLDTKTAPLMTPILVIPIRIKTTVAVSLNDLVIIK